MRKYYTSLLLLLSIAFNSSGQIVQSSFMTTDSIAISKYTYDAEQLALKYIYRNNLPEKDSIKIPKTI